MCVRYRTGWGEPNMWSYLIEELAETGPIAWPEVAYPVTVAGGFAIASLIAAALGWDIPNLPAFIVGAVAYASNKAGMRAGLMTATLSALTCNLFFAQGLHFGFHSLTMCQCTSYLAQFLVAVAAAPHKAKPQDALIVLNDAELRDCKLPFTRQEEGKTGLHGTGKRYWTEPPTGDWARDFEVGAEYGRVYVDLSDAGQPCPEACWILADMMEQAASRPAGQRLSGLEAGFIQALSHRARAVKARRLRQPPEA